MEASNLKYKRVLFIRAALVLSSTVARINVSEKNDFAKDFAGLGFTRSKCSAKK